MKHTVTITWKDRYGVLARTQKDFTSFNAAMNYLERAQELPEGATIMYERTRKSV